MKTSNNNNISKKISSWKLEAKIRDIKNPKKESKIFFPHLVINENKPQEEDNLC